MLPSGNMEKTGNTDRHHLREIVQPVNFPADIIYVDDTCASLGLLALEAFPAARPFERSPG